MIYDVIIIGAGVSGCAVARELSRYDLHILVLEREEDVCCGTSKANSAIVHAGFDAMPGTRMAALNVRGNAMMEDLCRDLDVPFKRNGAMVVCTDPDARQGLQELYDRGIANGVPGLEILDGAEAHRREPNLADGVCAALYAPTSGIVCPFTLTIALAENAAANGVTYAFDQQVTGLSRNTDGSWHMTTAAGAAYDARLVVNAAGVYADVLHNMVSAVPMHITPRRGDYCLLDRTAGTHVSHTVFAQPTKVGKGVLVTPTVHGNLLVGPTAIDTLDRDGTNTTQEGIDILTSRAAETVRDLPMRQVITSFAGLRAHEDGHEFIIGECPDAPGFIDCAGIESPGLSASPAIGALVRDIVAGLLHPAEKADWTGTRKGILDPTTLSIEERNALIHAQPAYGRIICRCESVSEGEILDAIHRTPGARSLDGVKRRVRAGMGRCQAGFCSPRTMEILSRELGIPFAEITKSGGCSRLVYERTKGEDAQ